MSEEWSWGKWLGGFLEGRRYGKDLAIVIRVCILLAIISTTALGILWIKDKLTHKAVQTPDIVTAETANIDKSNRSVTETYLPLANFFGFSSKKNNDGCK